MNRKYESFDGFIEGMSHNLYAIWYYQEATRRQRMIADRIREVMPPVRLAIEREEAIEDMARLSIEREERPPIERPPRVYYQITTTKRDILISSRNTFLEKIFRIQEYAGKTGTNYNTARRELSTAEKKGILRRVRKGEYQYT